MKKIVMLALVLGGSAFAADTGVKAVDAAWGKAMMSNSVDAVMACYASDAIAWLPEQAEAKGTAAIRTAYQGLLNTVTIVSASLPETHYDNSGKIAVGWGRYNLTVIEKSSGQTNVWAGRFTELAERRNGRWVYILDHASPDPEPMAPASP
jgi:ketosteroid isomerase-like protein